MHVRYLLAELGVTATSPLLATALLAPLEIVVLEQQVRTEPTSPVDRHRTPAGTTWSAAWSRH